MQLIQIILKNKIPIIALLAISLSLTIILQNNMPYQARTVDADYPSSGTIEYQTKAGSQNMITFSGYNWTVRNQNNSKPGPNNYSNSMENVWVDDNGYLHLKITNRDGSWYCPEVYCTQAFGYGTYTFHTSSPIDSFDKNVVLGLFVYKDDSHEVDIEYSKWGYDSHPNTGFTVQPAPYIRNYNTKSFNTALTGVESTHLFTWGTKSVFFETIQGNYNIDTAPAQEIINSWTCNLSTDSTGAITAINLWLYKGYPPSNGQSVEVVITAFEFSAE